MRGFDSVAVKAIRRTGENSFEAAFSVPERASYFNLHFDRFKLLPAVAEIDIVINLLAAATVREYALLSIKSAKFVSPIRPNDECILSLSLEGDTLSFNIAKPDGEKFSFGKLKVAAL